LRVHRSETKTLDGEDGPHTLVSEGKGRGGLSGYRSMPWSCLACLVDTGSAAIAWP
jgi:hypothetical protein